MDVNIKNLEPEVLDRLTEQAKAEGLSQQEYIRQILRRNAARMSPAELLASRSMVEPMTEEEFRAVERKVAERNRKAAQRQLDALDGRS